MRYGICPLSVVPVYASAGTESPQITQLLYGEVFQMLEGRKQWSRIRTFLDGCEGWIHADQWLELEETRYLELTAEAPAVCAADLVGHSCTRDGLLLPVLLGSSTGHAAALGHQFEGAFFEPPMEKDALVQIALLYLNSPELAGGRSPFGIDAAGLTQMVYKCSGVALKRNPAGQATQGTPLSFIEESSPGDLAFFDGPDGTINHVGIIMKDNYIIHAFGRVRIDRIDHSGIFNNELRRYTHPLRVIVQILP